MILSSMFVVTIIHIERQILRQFVTSLSVCGYVATKTCPYTLYGTSVTITSNKYWTFPQDKFEVTCRFLSGENNAGETCSNDFVDQVVK